MSQPVLNQAGNVFIRYAVDNVAAVSFGLNEFGASKYAELVR